MIQDVTLCLLLSEKDKHLWPAWKEAHHNVCANIIVGMDGNFQIDHSDMDASLTTFKLDLKNDFAKARNTIMEKVSSPYVMWLDADELLLPDQEQLLKSAISVLGDDNFIAAIRYNVFERRFVDHPNYHAFLMSSSMRYKNNSLGAHETPNSTNILSTQAIKILHLKETWVNFRSKGYKDTNQDAALEDLQKKIDKVRQDDNI